MLDGGNVVLTAAGVMVCEGISDFRALNRSLNDEQRLRPTCGRAARSTQLVYETERMTITRKERDPETGPVGDGQRAIDLLQTLGSGRAASENPPYPLRRPSLLDRLGVGYGVLCAFCDTPLQYPSAFWTKQGGFTLEPNRRNSLRR